MQNTKICGWFLLSLGIGIIFWSVYSSYNVFTGKSAAPQVFKMETFQNMVLGPDETEKESKTQAEKLIQQASEEIIQEQLKGLLPYIPDDAIVKLLNLFAWSIFAGIAIFAGSQISNLGIKLVRKNE